MLTYLGLFYQDCLRQGRLAAAGLLPPVLPLDGKRRWRAARDVSELIEEIPGGWDAYQPRLRYALIDEGALNEVELSSLQNLVGALIRLEKGRDLEAVREVLAALSDWLEELREPELKRAWSLWIRQVFLSANPSGTTLSELADFQEVKVMLAEKVKDWAVELREEGRQEGREEGRQQGREEGIQQSLLALRVRVFQRLAERFGFPPSEATRRKVESLSSVEGLADLIAQIPTAASLAELGLE